ncbi:MAG TPA: hypothetical protein VFM18_06310 [Methanosarcina sp.]|nr:hypothetical protein [Methanosarcina sp.]
MITHDPWNGKQISFERTDRTGRYSPLICEQKDSAFKSILLGAASGIVIAILLFIYI